ncbi:hypothetical protein [Phenylobacterium sp.]|jgi:predicted O-methyltransferase YrrM|uniref:hypothetical protein n=1 Tax=Phenylobacterium sp. TaxID=1871053 RepID=UPI002F920559
MSLTADVARRVRGWVEAWPAQPDGNMLYRILRFMAQWRSLMLSNTYQNMEGLKVWGGPFAGMEYLTSATEGALMPRLLGTYESELHPHLLALLDEGVDVIVDVGCAEGYYAVGLARLAPTVSVHARDIEEKAQAACRALAEKNGVADRVVVGGEFRPEDFESFAGKRVLVLVDAEGAELDVLRPELAPSLASMSIVVETHDVYRPGALATLVERFSPTHEIIRVDQQPKVFEAPAWMANLVHLDQLLCVWEWRLQQTPWLVMRPKAET